MGRKIAHVPIASIVRIGRIAYATNPHRIAYVRNATAVTAVVMQAHVARNAAIQNAAAIATA